MIYSIQISPRAAKAIRKLDKTTARRVLAAIETLAKDPRPPECRQLKGGSGEYRIRVGSYRIVYSIVDGELIVLVFSVGHRREVYR